MINIQKIVAIQNHGIAGTSLLHSLFDNHSKIISLPWLFGINFIEDWNETFKEKKANFNELKKFIKANYKVLFDIGSYNEKSLSMLGKNMDQKVEVSENTFFSFLKKNLGQLSEISRREFIIGVFLSYNECFGKKFDDDCYICFPIHSRPLIIAECLREDFEELKFIHMTREPVQNISSCMKQYNVKDLSPFNGLLRMATQQVINDIGEQLDNQKLYGNQPYFQDSLKVQSRYVRLEDVHNFGKKELSRIAKWLNIEFEKSMLTSTFMNLEWHNRASSPRITGLNKVTISQRFDE